MLKTYRGVVVLALEGGVVWRGGVYEYERLVLQCMKSLNLDSHFNRKVYVGGVRAASVRRVVDVQVPRFTVRALA